MVIFVQYNIPKEYFVKHKKELKKILHKTAFEVAVLKFEKEVDYKEIAKKLGLTLWVVRRILSNVCEQIRNIK